MALPNVIKQSKLLRSPLLAACRRVFSLLYKGPAVLRRAVYDAAPMEYIIAEHREKYVVAMEDKVIGREIFLHGAYDLCKLENAVELLRKEGVNRPRHLIDVGANIGTITIPALTRKFFDSATAIEPHPRNLQLLRANIALNDIFDCVEIVNRVAASETGVSLLLAESRTNSGNHRISDSGIHVRAVRLDDLDLPSVNCLLWMDIEGYEGHALDGAKYLLSSGIPLVSEFNPEFLRNSGGLDMFEKAIEGRRIFDLQASDPSPTTLAEITQRISKNAKNQQWTDILAIP